MTFSAKDRVRISTDYHWARGANATICSPPEYITSLAPGWDGLTRTVQAVRGPLTLYWVRFDDAQTDADGDGPYFEAEIEETALSAI